MHQTVGKSRTHYKSIHKSMRIFGRMFAKFKDMEEKICDTPITGKYVADHVKPALGPHAIIRGIKDAKRIAVGQGFLTHLLRMELEWEKEDEGLPKVVIVKPAKLLLETMTKGGNEQMKAVRMLLVTIAHGNECDFYHLLGKDPPIVMPKCYVAVPVLPNAPGMIILQDLSDKAAMASSVIQGLNLQQVLAAVTEVARLHAWSLTTSVDWHSQIPTLKSREPITRQILASFVAGFRAAKEAYPDEFGSLDLEKLAPYVTYEMLEKITSEHREFMDDVLIHGDFHMYNMLFEKKPDGTIGDKLVALIDFQAVMKGSIAYDLGCLMAFSVSTKIRRDHIDEILHRYYDEIKSIAGDKFKATFEQLRQVYEKNFAFTALTSVSSIQRMHQIFKKSEGEQKIKDEQAVVNKIKEDYLDAVKMFGL